MRITCILLLCAFLNAKAEFVYSQSARISLDLKNATVEEVLNTIEENSEFYFLYNSKLVDVDRKVDVQAKSKQIFAILDEVFSSTDVLYKVEDRQIILSKKSWDNIITQQTGKRITGTITDAGSGETIIGANVVEKGVSGNGTITNADGKFTINVADGATLIVSYIGYATREVAVGNQTTLQITLTESMMGLDEVVVVGYGTMKKVNLTGAVDQVRGDKLENRPIISVPQALQGMVGGLNITSGTGYGPTGGGAPGARMSINLRGVTGLSSTSASSSASPLIVVDGVQGQDINSINPDDIASISVLKDASSAAIYGSSAPYGVILITTKKGSKGDSKPVVSYSANGGWSSTINLPAMMNSVDWAQLINEANFNASGRNYIPDAAVQRIQDYFYGRITTTTIPTANGLEWASYDDDYGNDNIDWFKEFYKDWSFSQQHNVGFSGGSEKSTYYVGLGYRHKDGMYNHGNDDFNRYSIRGNLSSNLTSWLTTNIRSSFGRDLTNTPSVMNASSGGIMHNMARTWPIIPLYNPDGSLSRQNYVEQMENGGRTKTTHDDMAITGEFVISPIKGWNTTFNYTFNKMNEAYNRDDLRTVATRPDGSFYDGLVNLDNILRENSYNEQQTVNLFTSYERSISGHNMKAMIGYAQELYKTSWVDAGSGSGLLYVTDIPALGAMYNNTPTASESHSSVATRGAFGRINYDYQEKYLLELSGRYDGSSRFLKDVRFKTYPGVSAGWVVSKEEFWESIKSYVDFFKIRGDYGSLGDISFLGTSYYPFYPSLGTTSATSTNYLFNGARSAYITAPGIVNDQLTWITSTTLDFGVDLSLFGSRFTATFDWFRRSSDDIVGPAEQKPAVLGASAPNANNAAIETNGFELTLNWRDQIGDFTYGLRATLADSKSTVMKYPNETMAINRWYKGAVVGDIWGYETEGFYTVAEQEAGIDQNRQKAISSNTWRAGDIKYLDRNGDGLITTGESTVTNPGDRTIIGNNQPRYSYGFTIDAGYKGFDASIFLQGIGKRDAWLTSNYFWGIYGNGIWQATLFTDHLDRWSADNTGAYYPNFYTNNTKNQQTQTKYLQDASYMRIKNLQIGYTLPRSILSQVSIDKLRIYISGENLATFTKMTKTIDPEFAVSDGKIYPLQSTWSFGLNLTF